MKSIAFRLLYNFSFSKLRNHIFVPPGDILATVSTFKPFMETTFLNTNPKYKTVAAPMYQGGHGFIMDYLKVAFPCSSY